MKYQSIKKTDPEMYKLIRSELKRQQEGMELIPSENIVSESVIEALGSVLTNKYSEGYPGARYYGGNEYIDKIENLARDRAKKVFGVPHANVQPYSGSPANLAVYLATCEPGDTVMGQFLFDGGHLTHGWKLNVSSKFFNAIGYHVQEDGYIDMDEVEKLAKKHRPKLIWIGATAYPRKLPFQKFAKIADGIGAYLVADISHVTGLIIAGVHPSPVQYAHIITTTTHKTLRGPRGGMILVTKKGLKKDKDLAKKIDKAIIPGSQGGPHNHQTASVAVALGETMKPAFKKYGKQIVENAKTLAKALKKEKLELVSGGTDNHLILVKCGKGRGIFVEKALDQVGITVNKNTIPKDPSSPFYPSGIRIGTPSITTRGMKTKEMEKIARWIRRVMDEIQEYDLPENKKEIREYIRQFEEDISKNKNIKKIHKEVKVLCKKFMIYNKY
jgi:glycine hydroxymethyltransferase